MNNVFMLEDEIPPEIIKAARDVEAYFAGRGIKSWELLGICSRNHAYVCQTVMKGLVTLNEKARIMDLETINQQTYWHK